MNGIQSHNVSPQDSENLTLRYFPGFSYKMQILCLEPLQKAMLI